ncbi:hypothetical protein [Sporomusa acidovorans]|uniref:Chromosome partition protein Smc n=1 Tax=Sporomusa acidovorans (strain ATCC 49682 / DSM 3132 / Mol) TaxID=1123286 RepID=A0ABZ3J7I9_SPOA4|nr:hypothetical protein [Sporomusa acidovorans]OZC23452.1 chromosome partition protein Smc [Sporomusa acidovorans DSM 3132]SDF27316.1 hypothetical protein SAMN04488499_10414 [Sporomusa acidovorans]
MSEERFDRLEKMLIQHQNQLNQMQTMMEQLIKMVGHNNAVTEELCERVDKLETRFDNLETRFDKLETRFDNLETRFDNLETRFDNLEARFDNLETRLDNHELQTQAGFQGLTAMVNLLGEKLDAIPRLEAKLDILNNRLLETETDVRLLKKAL